MLYNSCIVLHSMDVASANLPLQMAFLIRFRHNCPFHELRFKNSVRFPGTRKTRILEHVVPVKRNRIQSDQTGKSFLLTPLFRSSRVCVGHCSLQIVLFMRFVCWLFTTLAHHYSRLGRRTHASRTAGLTPSCLCWAHIESSQ